MKPNLSMNQQSCFPSTATFSEMLPDMATVLGVAKALIDSASIGEAERQVLDGVAACCDMALIESVRAAVEAEQDPLGEAYCAINIAEQRRDRGQTFTPEHVVAGMFGWVKRQRKVIARLVDPGAGSGRYTLAGLRAFPEAEAVAVEMDPTVALILRANLAAAGFAERVSVVVGDFRSLQLSKISGVTLFVGNPPYVRHHHIASEWKSWYSRTLKSFGHEGSQLAGLHLHFFLKTLELASEGDLGCYVTAAEWLDVKYGQALRQLLTNGLGGNDVFVVDPTVQVFGDALVSAAITCFSPGSKDTKLHFAEVATETDLRKLASGAAVEMAAAKAEPKWSFLLKGGRAERPAGFMELGEIFRISRGQVTGLNRVWIESAETPVLPARFLMPAITDSADITRAEEHIIDDVEALRRVVYLPRDLGSLGEHDKAAVDRFLEWARSLGAHETYIAQHRNPWWSVGFKEAAPIVMTCHDLHGPQTARFCNQQGVRATHQHRPWALPSTGFHGRTADASGVMAQCQRVAGKWPHVRGWIDEVRAVRSDAYTRSAISCRIARQFDAAVPRVDDSQIAVHLFASSNPSGYGSRAWRIPGAAFGGPTTRLRHPVSDCKSRRRCCRGRIDSAARRPG